MLFSPSTWLSPRVQPQALRTPTVENNPVIGITQIPVRRLLTTMRTSNRLRTLNLLSSYTLSLNPFKLIKEDNWLMPLPPHLMALELS
jgi:hypothetical protein